MTTFPVIRGPQAAVLATSILASIIPVVAVSLRILSHRVACRSLAASDYFAIASAATAIGFHAVLSTTVVQCGVGWGHVAEIEAAYGPAPIHKMFKLLLVLEMFWATSMSLSKTSILLLYAKLFKDSCMVKILRAIAVFVLLWAISVILGGFLICNPVSANWEPSSDEHCGNQILLYFFNGLFNLATDVIVILLPLPHLRRLRLPKQTKIVLAIVLSLGVLTCIISTIRLVYMRSIELGDLPWTLPLPAILTGLEPSMAVTLCCVPLLRPLLAWGKQWRLSRVRVAENILRMEQYDPEQARKLRLRSDRVAHQAVVSVDGLRDPIAATVPNVTDSDSSSELKEEKGTAPDITVNKESRVASEAGEWTQILGSR